MKNTPEQIAEIARIKGEAAQIALTGHAQLHNSYDELVGEAKSAAGGLIGQDHDFFRQHLDIYGDHALGEWTSYEEDQAAAGVGGVRLI